VGDGECVGKLLGDGNPPRWRDTGGAVSSGGDGSARRCSGACGEVAPVWHRKQQAKEKRRQHAQ
jgi:hypothetical protein